MSKMLIQANQLIDAINNPDLLILDVRHNLLDANQGLKLHEQSRIVGSYFMHQDYDLASALTGTNGRHPLPDASLLAKKLERLGLKSDSKVVVYDADNSSFAVRAWWLLRWLGHTNVAVLNGGFSAWQKNNGPIQSGKLKIDLTNTNTDNGSCTANNMPVKNAQQVLDILNNDTYILVDARDNVRYKGESEPLDPVAGRIPGALNRPILSNLNPDLTFKDADKLRAEFQELFGSHKPENVINYCGSGVTACHNIFAMELAGLSGSSLYSGSWSEWCSDANRPLQRG